MGALEDVILLPAGEIILDEEARERARQAIYDDIEAEHLTRAVGNVWLEKLQESHQFGTFETVLSIFHERLGTLADYLDPRTVMVWSDDALVRKEINEHHWKVGRDWSESRSTHEWKRPPQELFLEPEELQSALEPLRQVWVNSISGSASKAVRFDLDAGGHEELTLAVKSYPQKDRLLEPLARQFQEWQQGGIVCFLVCHQKGQAKRMAELLKGYGVDALFSGAPFGKNPMMPLPSKSWKGNWKKVFSGRRKGLLSSSKKKFSAGGLEGRPGSLWPVCF